MGRSALEFTGAAKMCDSLDPFSPHSPPVPAPADLAPAELAAIIISMAHRRADRPMTNVEEGMYTLIIGDLMRRGVTNVHEIAWKALEQEGYMPRYVNMGELGYIGIGTIAETRSARRLA